MNDRDRTGADKQEGVLSLSREEAEACLDAISDHDWAYYISVQSREFLEALRAKLRAFLAEGKGTE